MALPLFYNFKALPYWNHEDIASSSFTTSDRGIGTNQLAPYSQDFHQGYDAHGRLNVARRQRVLTKANANFCDGQYKFPLFIHKVTLDFALSGVTAQSQLTRDYYPHNMVLPGFQLEGQCYDQFSYGELCEFIHAQQHRSITGSSRSGSQTLSLPLIQLYIRGNVHPINGHRRVPGIPQGVNYNGQFKPNQTIKGQHEDILCLGYIMSMPREHKTGDYAPKYKVSFMISNMLHGPYQDGIGTIVEQTTWQALLTGSQNFTNKADLAENKQVLKYAQQNAGNVTSLG